MVPLTSSLVPPHSFFFPSLPSPLTSPPRVSCSLPPGLYPLEQFVAIDIDQSRLPSFSVKLSERDSNISTLGDINAPFALRVVRVEFRFTDDYRAAE